MQKVFIAIAFALALTCASAVYTPSNFVKPPVKVVEDAETNFTNVTVLGLASVNIGELDLLALTAVANTSSPSLFNFVTFYRKLDAKGLTGTENKTVTFYRQFDLPLNGYGVDFIVSNDSVSNLTNLRAIQVPFTGGAALPTINLSSNTNNTFSPKLLSVAVIGKNVYVFHQAAEKKVNVTSFTVGGSAAGKVETQLTTAYDGALQTVWGEALGSNQVYAIWREGDLLKSSTVDVTKTTATSASVDKYNKTSTSWPYATDKKLVGVFSANTDNGTTTYSATTNSSSLVTVTSSSANASVTEIFPYGPYLAVIYSDSKSDTKNTVYSYEIWDLEKLNTTKAKTQFLSIDSASTARIYRVTSAGVYVLLYNNPVTTNGTTGTITSVQVGQLLGGSYLASVFGFLLTIIAGLFLF